MKNLVVLFAACVLLFTVSGCQKDNVDDLKSRVKDLEAEQKKQAELLKNYGLLLEALQGQLSAIGIVAVEGGYNVTFSNGEVMSITNGYTAVIKKGENGNWYIGGTDSGIEAGDTAPEVTISYDDLWVIDGEVTSIPASSTGYAGTHIVGVIEFEDKLVFMLSNGGTQVVYKNRGFLYVLSEGYVGYNNSELTRYDVNTGEVITGFFAKQNGGEKLGDTGNDMLLYGSKIYCAISGSNLYGEGYVQVIDAKTGVVLKRIAMEGDNSPQVPRKFTTYQGEVYVSLYGGGVAAIDTTLLNIRNYTVLTGGCSEGICAQSGKLYVCNSGEKGDPWGGGGTTVSVVDVASFQEEDVVTVPLNPNRIGVAPNGEIYLGTWGNYGSIGQSLHIFDPKTKKVVKSFDVPIANFSFDKEYVYTVAVADWTNLVTESYKINLKTREVSTFVESASMPPYSVGYSVDVNPYSGDIYMVTQLGDEVLTLDSSGEVKKVFRTGVANGSKVVFVN